MRPASKDMDLIQIPVVRDGEETVTAGVSLGFDFCAEHEHGISQLLSRFGAGQNLNSLGLDSRVMTGRPEPENLLWYENGTDCGLVYALDILSDMRYAKISPDRIYAVYEDGTEKQFGEDVALPREGMVMLKSDALPDFRLRNFRDKLEYTDRETGRWVSRKPKNKAERAQLLEETSGFMTAWSERDFAVIGRGAEAAGAVRLLRDALMNNSLVMSIGRRGVFRGAGLNLMDIRLVPEWFAAECKEQDIAHRELLDAVKKTGIEDLLKDAGKRYYALSPQWVQPNEMNGLLGLVEERTELKFWLNPMAQKENNYGYISLYDLEDWIYDTGYIPMKNDAAALYPDFSERLHMKLDPEGYDRAADISEAAGLNMSRENMKESGIFFHPFLTDGEQLHRGDSAVVLVTSLKSGFRSGWFTPAEILDATCERPSPMTDTDNNEFRTIAEVRNSLLQNSFTS